MSRRGAYVVMAAMILMVTASAGAGPAAAAGIVGKGTFFDVQGTDHETVTQGRHLRYTPAEAYFTGMIGWWAESGLGGGYVEAYVHELHEEAGGWSIRLDSGDSYTLMKAGRTYSGESDPETGIGLKAVEVSGLSSACGQQLSSSFTVNAIEAGDGDAVRYLDVTFWQRCRSNYPDEVLTGRLVLDNRAVVPPRRSGSTGSKASTATPRPGSSRPASSRPTPTVSTTGLAATPSTSSTSAGPALGAASTGASTSPPTRGPSASTDGGRLELAGATSDSGPPWGLVAAVVAALAVLLSLLGGVVVVRRTPRR